MPRDARQVEPGGRRGRSDLENGSSSPPRGGSRRRDRGGRSGWLELAIIGAQIAGELLGSLIQRVRKKDAPPEPTEEPKRE